MSATCYLWILLCLVNLARLFADDEEIKDIILTLQTKAGEAGEHVQCPPGWRRITSPRRVFYGVMLGPYDLDQLEALLYEAAALVYRYIIVEADHTHQGKRKNIYLPKLLEEGGRLALYKEKVVHHVVTLDPAVCSQDAWFCEGKQRDAIWQVAQGAGMRASSDSEDLLISADADEILSWERTNTFRWCEWGVQPLRILLPNYVYNLQWEYAYWTLTLVAPANHWLHPEALSLAETRRLEPSPYQVLGGWGNGWHCSFFGGPDLVRSKILAFAHAEYNREPYSSREFIVNNMREGLEPFHRGPLVATLEKTRPRIVAVRRVYECWFDSLSKSCRDEHDVAELLDPPLQTCMQRFVNSALPMLSGTPADHVSYHTEVQRKAQRRCEIANGDLHTVYLLATVNVREYAKRCAWRSSSCKSLYSAFGGLDPVHPQSKFTTADVGNPRLMCSREGLGLATCVRSRPVLRGAASFGICSPLVCLSSGADLLSVVHRVFSAGVAAHGFQSAELPELTAHEVDIHTFPPVGGRGLRPVQMLHGLGEFTLASNRLVLAWLRSSGGTEVRAVTQSLRRFLASLRRSQVDARVVLIVPVAIDLTICTSVARHHEADCVPVGAFSDENVCSGVPPAVLDWCYLGSYIQEFALNRVKEVLVTESTDVVFQSCPFLHRPASAEYLLATAQHSSVLLGDWTLYRVQCSSCAGHTENRDCESTLSHPILSTGFILGTSSIVLQFLLAATNAYSGAQRPCDRQVMLNRLVWTGRLTVGMDIQVAIADKSAFCAFGHSTSVRVNRRGEVMNAAGRVCTVVHEFGCHDQVRRVFERYNYETVTAQYPLLHRCVESSLSLDGRREEHCASPYRISPAHNLSGCVGNSFTSEAPYTAFGIISIGVR